MKRFLLASLAALLGLLATHSSVSAQFTYPLQGGVRYPGWQTPLSPYLNLLRPGNPAVNYYGLVEPEIQRRQDRGVMFNSIQSLANQLPPRPGTLAEEEFNAPLRSTGHPTAFGYTGSYFGGGVNTAVRPTTNPFTRRQAGPASRYRQPPTKPKPTGK